MSDTITKKDLRKLKDTVEWEGFDYAFAHYSSYDYIKDKEFHKLREKFLAARQELIEYLGLTDV